MEARPIIESCARWLEQREHACFGISPFNGYFSERRIEALAAWGLREFRSIHFFVPDTPAAFTLEALGYPPQKAMKKARRQGQYTINKIVRALRNLAVSDMSAQTLVLNWNVLSENERYLQLYQQAQDLYAADPAFRKECLEASQWVLEKRVGPAVTKAMLRAAARYFLAEIPLFADTAGIVGVSSSCFCYHQSIPFMEKLYRGQLAFPVSGNQAYVIVQSETCRK